MAKIQNTDNIKCWQGCGAKGTHSVLVGMQNGTATLEDKVVVSYKTKHICKILSSHHAPWYLPEGVENLSPHTHTHTQNHTQLFIVALFIIAKIWKQPNGLQ